MIRHLLLMLILSIPVLQAQAQSRQKVEVGITGAIASASEIFHGAGPLTLSHFQGRPDPSSHHGAMSYCGIRMSYKYRVRGGIPQVSVSICPYLDTELSWFRPTVAEKELLKHEQGHFDIAARLAEELAVAIRSTRFIPGRVEHQLLDLHDRYIEKLRKMQRLYDSQTRHGLEHSRQEYWNQLLLRPRLRIEGSI